MECANGLDWHTDSARRGRHGDSQSVAVRPRRRARRRRRIAGAAEHAGHAHGAGGFAAQVGDLPGGRRISRPGDARASEFAAAFIEEWGLAIGHDEFLARFAAWVGAPYPETAELLSGLGGRHTLACLSNTNAVHWESLRRMDGLRPVLERPFVSHELGLMKPSPEVFARGGAASSAASRARSPSSTTARRTLTAPQRLGYRRITPWVPLRCAACSGTWACCSPAGMQVAWRPRAAVSDCNTNCRLDIRHDHPTPPDRRARRRQGRAHALAPSRRCCTPSPAARCWRTRWPPPARPGRASSPSSWRPAWRRCAPRRSGSRRASRCSSRRRRPGPATRCWRRGRRWSGTAAT